mgnify:CR=1 FL=1
MQFLHFKLSAGPDNIVQVNLNSRANVRLMDELNFQKYRLKKRYSFSGGVYDPPKVDLRPKRKDEWHVVVDLEGIGGDVRASVDILG